MKFEAPRGTQDVLPAQQPLWEKVTRTAEDICAAYGYGRITTPVFEDTELFARTSGAGSDVVQKEMYTFTDRGDRSLTLRPEATASVARAYVQHGLHREPQPVKTFFIGPLYRYAAPQRGKFREFWQLNVEAMGSDDPAIDAEIIQLFSELLRRLEIEGWWLELNSIGDRNCRPVYLEQLNAWLDEHEQELDEDTLAKRRTSPLRVFDNLPQKPEPVQRALETAPKIGESLCEECQTHFDAVRRYLDACGVSYRLSPTLVRGLDYYTRTTFEFMAEALGAALSLAGRRALRLSDRGDRRSCRLRPWGSRAGSSDSSSRSWSRGARFRIDPSMSSSRSRTTRSEPTSSPRWPTSAAPAAQPTPTTPAAHSRGSSRRPAASGRRRP